MYIVCSLHENIFEISKMFAIFVGDYIIHNGRNGYQRGTRNFQSFFELLKKLMIPEAHRGKVFPLFLRAFSSF